MNKDEKSALIAIACILGISLIQIVKETKHQRKIRAEIDSKLEADLSALRVAHARIQERIQSGQYQGRSASVMMQDFEFERIRAFNEE